MRYKELTMCEMLDVIRSDDYAMLAVSNNNLPYTIPMFYNFREFRGKYYIFMISSQSGTKMEFMESNKNVCVSFDERNRKCDCMCNEYLSVLAFGTANLMHLDNYDTCDCMKDANFSVLVSELVHDMLPCNHDNALIVISVDKFTGRKYY